jgi:thioredoxin reductase
VSKRCESLQNTTFRFARNPSGVSKGRTENSRKSCSKADQTCPGPVCSSRPAAIRRPTLSERLGCKRNTKGGVVIDPDTEESSVSGVYVAGDASRDVLLVAVAIAEGAQAAVAINKAFLRRDGFCD